MENATSWWSTVKRIFIISSNVVNTTRLCVDVFLHSLSTVFTTCTPWDSRTGIFNRVFIHSTEIWSRKTFAWMLRATWRLLVPQSHAHLTIHHHILPIDFGVCDVVMMNFELKKTRGLCGSMPYIAPEEWSCDEYDAQKADIWACGIIFLTLTFHSFPVIAFLVLDSWWLYSGKERVEATKTLSSTPPIYTPLSTFILSSPLSNLHLARLCGLF